MKSPIRVLHMISILEMGGSQSMVMNLYRAIDRERVQFDFIVDHADKDTTLRKEIELLGGRIFSFPSFKGGNVFEIRETWNRFFEEHKEYSIFHTHSRSYASVYLPIANKHGLITIAHSHSTSNGKGVISLVKNIMQYPIRYQADYLFACSQQAGEWLFGKRVTKSSRFLIISNAINSKRFEYDSVKREYIRKELGIRDEFVVGHIGRMTKPKNHEFLIKLFNEYNRINNNSKLLLVGDGELLEEVKNQVGELHIDDKVLFVGSKANTEDYYQAMDCFLFPSLWEGLGMAVVEAQAAGLQCVVSNAVPTKVDIGANLVTFLNLNDSCDKWIKSILGADRKKTSSYVKDAGFDIEESAKFLQSFYEKVEYETKDVY